MCRAKKENPMAVRSKNALSQSLLKLLIYKPFSDISISDITSRAGLSRQAFYTNFERREDILLYMLRGLFERYGDVLNESARVPENLLADYFIYWGGNREFLKLLFRRELGYLFEDCNRRFFVENTDTLDSVFRADRWQLPYIKAGIAGIAYEFVYMWLTEERGLPVEVLNDMTRNILNGAIFTPQSEALRSHNADGTAKQTEET